MPRVRIERTTSPASTERYYQLSYRGMKVYLWPSVVMYDYDRSRRASREGQKPQWEAYALKARLPRLLSDLKSDLKHLLALASKVDDEKPAYSSDDSWASAGRLDAVWKPFSDLYDKLFDHPGGHGKLLRQPPTGEHMGDGYWQNYVKRKLSQAKPEKRLTETVEKLHELGRSLDEWETEYAAAPENERRSKHHVLVSLWERYSDAYTKLFAPPGERGSVVALTLRGYGSGARYPPCPFRRPTCCRRASAGRRTAGTRARGRSSPCRRAAPAARGLCSSRPPCEPCW